MKTLLLLLSLGISHLTFAQSIQEQIEVAKKLNGRYQVDPKKPCNNGLEFGERIYLKLVQEKNFYYPNEPYYSIHVTAHGDDSRASGREFLLGQAKRQFPGTSPSTHGKVLQTWKTRFVESKNFTYELVTDAPKRKIHFASVHSLIFWTPTKIEFKSAEKEKTSQGTKYSNFEVCTLQKVK